MKKLVNFFKSFSKTTIIHILALVICCLIQVILITKFKYVFGSNIDWMKQHIALPDYFRNLFYETGNLFPDFAFHLGAGQNIFYLAYYGLFSPIIMLSYLLPFISMGNYIMISSVILIIISTILLYYFLRKNNINNNICFITSLLLIFSSSYIFHSHRHIMFINYMPFLILCLIGVYRYFEKKKSGLLICNIFLMILTSYYYSVSGLITVCLYGIYYYYKKYSKESIKHLFKTLLDYLFRILIGILLSSFLLFPVIYIIFNGRNGTGFNFNFNYLIPKVNLEYLIYGTYGIGLTSILWISLVYSLIYLKKEYKIMSILLAVVSIIPIFNFILNGGLYLNGKVLIPFMPLFLFLIASMIKDIKTSNKSLKWLVLGLIVSILFINLNNKSIYFIIEVFIILILLLLFKRKKKYYYFIPIIIVSFIISLNKSIDDNLVTIDDYKIQASYLTYDVNKYINQNIGSIYRYQDDLSLANGINFSYGKLDYRTTLYSSTSNLNYLNSFYNTFNNNDIYRNSFMLSQTNNLLFQKFMGIRYLLTNKDVPYGYTAIKKYENGTLYENKNVYPIGLSTTHILNKDEYDKLSFMGKLLAYQNNVIVDDESSNSILNNEFYKINLKYKVSKSNNLKFDLKDDHYIINSNGNGEVLLELADEIVDDILIIRFRMNDIPSCKDGDTYITINGIKNLLTCSSWKYYNNNEIFDYVISSNDSVKELIINFGEGSYDISNIEIYKVSKDLINDSDINSLLIDFDKTSGNVIEGNINQEEDGYFIFTIPFDEGFKIYVDGNQVEIKKVNDAFIGFPILKGNHSIKLVFRAPYFNLGKIFSLVVGFIFIGVLIFEKKNSK